MKQFLWVIMISILSACTSVHQGTKSLNVNELYIKEKPLEVAVIPGEKISGSAECTYILGFPFFAPAHEAYGAHLDTSKGNFAGDRCTRGAFYQAIVSSNADVIISPQYRTSGSGFLCLPGVGWCLFENRSITVSGYKGTYQFSNGNPIQYNTIVYRNQMP